MNPLSKRLLFFICTSLCLAGVVACHADQTTVQNADQILKRWRLEMILPSGHHLTDDSQSEASRLHAQLGQLDPAADFFRDPAGLSENAFSVGIRLTSQGRWQQKDYHWSSDIVRTGKSWKFASCSSAFAYNACEYSPLLACIQRKATESIWTPSSSDSVNSTESRSLLMEWSKQCGMVALLKPESDSVAQFKIRNEQVIFEPSPLLSVLIYSGAWAGYEDAVVQATAAASLPAVTPCNRSDGACLQSPVSASSCLGCEKLVKGQLYTIFFVETLRQDYSAVRSVIYIP